MAVFNTISGSLVALMVLLLIGGAVMGLSVSGTDIVNPNTSQAEAERIRAETAHNTVMQQLAEELERAKTEAEITSIKLQQEAEQRRFEAQIAYIEQLNAAKISAYGRLTQVRDALLVMFGATASLCATLFAASRLFKASPTAPAVQPVLKETPSEGAIREQEARQAVQRTRREWREQARKNEQTWRAAQIMMARMMAARDPAAISTEEHDKLPLAG